jgi:hypothetical protein
MDAMAAIQSLKNLVFHARTKTYCGEVEMAVLLVGNIRDLSPNQRYDADPFYQKRCSRDLDGAGPTPDGNG